MKKPTTHKTLREMGFSPRDANDIIQRAGPEIAVKVATWAKHHQGRSEGLKVCMEYVLHSNDDATKKVLACEQCGFALKTPGNERILEIQDNKSLVKIAKTTLGMLSSMSWEWMWCNVPSRETQKQRAAIHTLKRRKARELKKILKSQAIKTTNKQCTVPQQTPTRVYRIAPPRFIY